MVNNIFFQKNKVYSYCNNCNPKMDPLLQTPPIYSYLVVEKVKQKEKKENKPIDQ